MREGVTYEQFAAYVEPRLENGGSLPSIREAVAELGGSATTVSKHRKRFLAARGEGQESQIPDEIAAGIEAAAKRLAGSLWEQAHEKFTAREQALADREAEIEADAERRVAAATAALAEVRSALDYERSTGERRGRQARKRTPGAVRPRRSTRRTSRTLRRMAG